MSTVDSQTNAIAPNSPELTEDLKQHVTAITSVDQAVQLIKALDAENSERSRRNARIMSKYNAERPYDPGALRADGLAWKSNFSTKPLATLIDKAVPRFTEAVSGMRYITASKLPDRFDNSTDKTDAFREEITKTCRAREGWAELITEIAMENTLFGYTCVAWMNPYSWFPTQFRQDDFLVSQGTKHTAASAPLFAVRERLLPHELFELIRDKDNATLAGWDVDNVIESINSAMPDTRRSGFSDAYRVYQDLIREAQPINSYTGAKQITIWHLFILEVDGTVTHIAFDNTSNKQLFYKQSQYNKLQDVGSFYSFQHGNGTMHGSKGIGRELYALAGIIDRNRNDVVDRLSLSGKMVLATDEKNLKRFKMSVVGSCILIGTEYTISQQKIDGNVEEFFKLDEFMQSILDQIAGSTSPKAFSGDRVTKAEVDLVAGREEERKDSLISRFLIQFARMVSTTQKRLCDPETIDDDAKEMQARLLQVMSAEELAYLANQPAVSTIEDYSEEERQQIVMWAQEVRGNPLYNQREVELKRVTAQFDAEFAEKVLLPQNDPTEQAEQARQQMVEMPLIGRGQTVPVSPRDNHVIHASLVHDTLMGLVEGLVQDPTLLPQAEALLQHAVQHIEAAEQAGNGKEVAQLKQWAQGVGATLQKYMQNEQAHAQSAAVGAPPPENPQGNQPVPPNGAPPQQ